VSDEPFHIATDEEISRLRMNEDYSTLVGPDGWWTFLGEPEDCTWSRDGRDVVDMLNKQAAEIARLTAERDASIAHRSATNEEIKKLHAVIKSKGFSVEDSVALHETRSEAARLTAELHRLAHGADIEGDGMCPHALEAANLRAELAAARTVPADVEALIKEVTDGALEAGSCSALGHTYSLTKDPTWTVPRLKATIARAISEARAAAVSDFIDGHAKRLCEQAGESWEAERTKLGCWPGAVREVLDMLFATPAGLIVDGRSRQAERARAATPSTVGGLLATARCSCTHEAGDSRCDAHPSCSECGAASARPVDGCEACRGTLSKGG